MPETGVEMNDDLVNLDVGEVSEIRLNNPPLNLITKDVTEQLSVALTRLEQASEVRVVVLSAAGMRAFCAGSDIGEAAGLSGRLAEEKLLLEKFVFRRLANLAPPTVAAIQADALGGGLELALCCDLRVSSVDARLGLPEVRIGAIPGSGGTQRLPRIVGVAHAKRMILTGEAIGAGEAVSIGLVNEIVEAKDVRGRALELAQMIGSCAHLAVREAKRLIDMSTDLPLDRGLAEELDVSQWISSTPDVAEGARAFFEKRAPRFYHPKDP